MRCTRALAGVCVWVAGVCVRGERGARVWVFSRWRWRFSGWRPWRRRRGRRGRLGREAAARLCRGGQGGVEAARLDGVLQAFKTKID